LDKKSYTALLDNKKGSSIDGCLSDIDLFSFDVHGESLRLNMEQLFRKYEQLVIENTTRVINDLRAGKRVLIDEIINIFSLKLLNTLRNPNCISFTIKILKLAPESILVGVDQRAIDGFIKNGNRPHEKAICDRYGVSVEQYQEWLRWLLIVLQPTKDGSSVFDKLVYSLFHHPLTYPTCIVHIYDNQGVLLPDQGFILPDLGSMSKSAISYLFNLTSDAFIVFGFVDNVSYLEEVRSKHPEFAKIPRDQMMASIAKSKKYISIIFQDMVMLQSFNRGAFLQSRHRVFCAKPYAYGINVITKK
jgi:hypothetical protein